MRHPPGDLLRRIVPAIRLLEHHFPTHPIHLVGSALWKRNPRDIDLCIELPDDIFLAAFGISATDWAAQGESGHWTPARWNWADSVSRICLACRPSASKSTSRPSPPPPPTSTSPAAPSPRSAGDI